MTLDRSVRLDVSLAGRGPRSDEGFDPGKQRGDPSDAADPEKFRQALEAQPAEPGMSPSAEGSPFGLPGPSLRVASDPQESEGRQLLQRLGEWLERLLVGEGAAGGKQVRMDLADEILPGVSVLIEQVEGRLQVEFTCTVDPSRLRLVAAAPAQAPSLAQRLDRPVLLRVQTDDEEDRRLLEIAAAP